MNTAKEKKLKAIKSEILEITKFVSSNKKDLDTNMNTKNGIEIDINDTFTLTNIVNSKQKVQTMDELAEIKKELSTLKSMLTKQAILIEDILLHIK